MQVLHYATLRWYHQTTWLYPLWLCNPTLQNRSSTKKPTLAVVLPHLAAPSMRNLQVHVWSMFLDLSLFFWKLWSISQLDATLVKFSQVINFKQIGPISVSFSNVVNFQQVIQDKDARIFWPQEGGRNNTQPTHFHFTTWSVLWSMCVCALRFCMSMDGGYKGQHENMLGR